MTKITSRILCLWFPHWPVQRLQNARPELKRRLIAVYEQRQGLRVVASNHPDVHPGLPLAEATGTQHERYDPLADLATLQRVAEWCEQFSPLVAIEQPTTYFDRPECLFLDITGLAQVFHSETALAERICRAFARRNLELRLAIADTLGMAWGLAHFSDALVCIAQRGNQARFAALPVAALRLPPAMIDVLAELGIVRVEQLLALPRAGLAARLGAELIDRLDQALGDKAELLEPHRAEPDIVVTRQFEFPLEKRPTIEAVLAPLMEEVAAKLAARQHGAIQIECTLHCPQHDSLKLLVSLFEASCDPQHLFALLQMRLERAVLPGPVGSLQLAVLHSARLVCRQQELFAAGQNHEREQSLLIDRLSGRLGREAVVRAELVADAQPEYAYRYEPLAGKKRIVRASPTKAKRSKKTHTDAKEETQPADKNVRPLPDRPLLLEPRPIPLDVVAVAPAGPPMQFRWQGEQHRTRRSWGPERIQTGWWRGRYIRRDYYRVESDQGPHYWLFRSGGKWFLHGIFA